GADGIKKPPPLCDASCLPPRPLFSVNLGMPFTSSTRISVTPTVVDRILTSQHMAKSDRPKTIDRQPAISWKKTARNELARGTSTDYDIRARVHELLLAMYPPGPPMERRVDRRYPYPRLIRLTPVAE